MTSTTTEAPPVENFTAQDPSFTAQPGSFEIPNAQQFEQTQEATPYPVANQTSRTATQDQAQAPVTEPQPSVEPVEPVPVVVQDKSKDLVTLAAVGTVAALTIVGVVLWK